MASSAMTESLTSSLTPASDHSPNQGHGAPPVVQSASIKEASTVLVPLPRL